MHKIQLKYDNCISNMLITSVVYLQLLVYFTFRFSSYIRRISICVHSLFTKIRTIFGSIFRCFHFWNEIGDGILCAHCKICLGVYDFYIFSHLFVWLNPFIWRFIINLFGRLYYAMNREKGLIFEMKLLSLSICRTFVSAWVSLLNKCIINSLHKNSIVNIEYFADTY